MKGGKEKRTGGRPGQALQEPGGGRELGLQGEGRREAALLFDHVLVDHGGDDGQGDDISSCGQNLCDLFVLEERGVSSHLGARGNSAGISLERSAWPLLEDAPDI